MFLIAPSCQSVEAPSSGPVLLLQCPPAISLLGTAGDRADASYAGYAFTPSSNGNVYGGHVGLLWSVLDTAQWNGRAGWEYGAKVLWHELM